MSVIYYKHETAKSRKTIFGGFKMKKDWILLSEETSQLYWCGGRTFNIFLSRNVVNSPRREELYFYTEDKIKDAWKKEQSYYDNYRTE